MIVSIIELILPTFLAAVVASMIKEEVIVKFKSFS